MHIPMQVDYAVRALVDLANNSGPSPVRAVDIAKRQGIPAPYLAQVLHSLQKNGLTVAHRGPTGGHELAMEPSTISMGMVMRYLDGPQVLIGCLDDAGTCGHSNGCGQRNIWRKVEQVMWQVLDSTSISDLVDNAPTKQEPADLMLSSSPLEDKVMSKEGHHIGIG